MLVATIQYYKQVMVEMVFNQQYQMFLRLLFMLAVAVVENTILKLEVRELVAQELAVEVVLLGVVMVVLPLLILVQVAAVVVMAAQAVVEAQE